MKVWIVSAITIGVCAYFYLGRWSPETEGREPQASFSHKRKSHALPRPRIKSPQIETSKAGEIAINDHTDIQSLLDNMKPGESVTLKGSAKLTTPLYARVPNVTLKGQLAKLDGSGLKNAFVIQADGVTLDGFQITGADGDVLVQEEPHQGTYLKNLVVSGSKTDDCVQLKYCFHCTIENIYAHDCWSDGISVAYSEKIKLINNRIRRSSSEFGYLYIYETDDILISGLQVTQSGSNSRRNHRGSGLFFWKTTGPLILHNVLLGDNIFSTQGAAIRYGSLRDPTRLLISWSVIKNNVGNLLKVEDSARQELEIWKSTFVRAGRDTSSLQSLQCSIEDSNIDGYSFLLNCHDNGGNYWKLAESKP